MGNPWLLCIETMMYDCQSETLRETYSFDFYSYRRSLRHPLPTSHGTWQYREGIFVALTGNRGTGWGEIAPLANFGSESLSEAVAFCQQLPKTITPETIFTIPNRLPACQFGLESAMENIEELPPLPPLQYSWLLPTGQAALSAWRSPYEDGYRTFKWKIGIANFKTEQKIWQQLLQKLPADCQLRLDANGGLDVETTKAWLAKCDRMRETRKPQIEFLEQPLPPHSFDTMRELNQQYATSIALDESVATWPQLQDCYQRQWRGIFVIKPCIAGSPSRLRKFCQTHAIDVVFSSALETEVGRKAALRLAAEVNPNRCVGFGVNGFLGSRDSRVGEGEEDCEQVGNHKNTKNTKLGTEAET